MSDKNVVHAHAQRDFRQALESEPEGTLLVLNERGLYVIPVAHRDAPFPEVVVRDEATLMGGHLPLHITVFDGGEISVEDVAPGAGGHAVRPVRREAHAAVCHPCRHDSDHEQRQLGQGALG